MARGPDADKVGHGGDTLVTPALVVDASDKRVRALRELSNPRADGVRVKADVASEAHVRNRVGPRLLQNPAPRHREHRGYCGGVDEAISHASSSSSTAGRLKMSQPSKPSSSAKARQVHK